MGNLTTARAGRGNFYHHMWGVGNYTTARAGRGNLYFKTLAGGGFDTPLAREVQMPLD